MPSSRKPSRSEATPKAVPLEPTHTFHIVPHSGLRKVIEILDITGQVTAAYGTDEFADQAKSIPKTSPPKPFLTVTRTPHWYSKQFIAESPSEPGSIATWKAGLLSRSSNHLTFPLDSTHSTHPVNIDVKSFWKFEEQFVIDSVPYIWRADNIWTMRQFTLCKSIGGEKVEVGKYWQGWEPFATGGTLVLNANEVDEVVGILTCLVVLRKKRHKDAERRNLAGG